MSAPPAKPRARRYMRDVLTIGARLRRRRDGAIVIVRQVHRVDREVQCVFEAFGGGVFMLTFSQIRREYELLTPLEGR